MENEKVTLEINGIEVVVEQGTTVIEAAKRIGIHIPALCYDPELSLTGSCRMCVVEIEGIKNLPTSCSTVATQGMVVKTHSEAVIESRKMILELLLADHPLDCMTCQKSGNCLLQQYTYEYQVKDTPFNEGKSIFIPLKKIILLL